MKFASRITSRGPTESGNGPRLGTLILLVGIVGSSGFFASANRRINGPFPRDPVPQEVLYANILDPSEPWSMHVIGVPRRNVLFELTTMHAGGKAIGLTPVTAQVAIPNSGGIPLAAINGDFFQREGPYAGDPRGLQVVDGELISAPSGRASFWIDSDGQPHAGTTHSRLRATFPDGTSVPIGLNGSRRPDRITLYSPAVGDRTLTRGGREFVLERSGDSSWLPLRPGASYRARVREIHESGDTRILPEMLILSVGPEAMEKIPRIRQGVELVLSMATEPDLSGVRAAISGGPMLVRNGRRLRIDVRDSDAYEFTTMIERHPRAAIGWNDDYILLATVDGRYEGVSEGMTLKEFAAFLVRLGCREALNLDGGGSATLWYDGRVRNYLCDGYERDVANSVIVRRRPEGIVREPAPSSARQAR